MSCRLLANCFLIDYEKVHKEMNISLSQGLLKRVGKPDEVILLFSDYLQKYEVIIFGVWGARLSIGHQDLGPVLDCTSSLVF